MEDDIDGCAKCRNAFADCLPHAALDAVAVNRLPHDLAHRQAPPRARDNGIAERGTVGPQWRTQNEEVSHLLRELFTAGLVNALVIGMFAETEGSGAGCH